MVNIGLYLDEYIEEVHAKWIANLENIPHSLIFINNQSNINTSLPILPAHEIWNFKDIIISNCFISGRYLYECPVPRHKFILVHGIDWQFDTFQALDYIKVYRYLNVLSANDKAYDLMKRVWDITPTPIEDLKDVQDKLIKGKTNTGS